MIKKYFNTQKVLMVTLISGLIFSPAFLFAQDDNLPCDGNDPYSGACPLDTWVLLFAFLAVVLAGIHLYRRQKSGTKSTSENF